MMLRVRSLRSYPSFDEHVRNHLRGTTFRVRPGNHRCSPRAVLQAVARSSRARLSTITFVRVSLREAVHRWLLALRRSASRAQQARSRPWPDLLASRARHLAVFRARSRFALLTFRSVERSESQLRFQSLWCRGSLHLSTHRPIRDDSRSSRPFWDIEPGPLVLALRRSRPIRARHLDARTYLARARLAAIALVSARSPPGRSGCSACVHLSATACVPARSPCGARDRARTLHFTVRGPFSVHVRLGAHVHVRARSPFGDRAHPRSCSPSSGHACAAR